MGKNNDIPPPPDYGPIAAASERTARLAHDLAERQFEWAQETWESDRELTDKVVSGMLDMQRFNLAAARQDREFYKRVFRPLERDLVRDARTYDTEARRDYEAGKAQAQVAQQFRGAREAAQRQLEGYGINPSASRYQALNLGVRLNEAAAKAAAGNQARDEVEAVGRALRSEALNIGRGYPGAIAGTYGTAIGAGTAGSGAQLSSTQVGGQVMGTAPQYMGQGNAALDIWGNTLTNQYNAEMDYYKAGQQPSPWASVLGQAAGIGLGIAIPKLAEGGAVPEEYSPSAGAIPDDVTAKLDVNEFVVPRDVAEWYGQKHLYGMIDKARKERTQAIPA